MACCKRPYGLAGEVAFCATHKKCRLHWSKCIACADCVKRTLPLFPELEPGLLEELRAAEEMAKARAKKAAFEAAQTELLLVGK